MVPSLKQPVFGPAKSSRRMKIHRHEYPEAAIRKTGQPTQADQPRSHYADLEYDDYIVDKLTDVFMSEPPR